MRFEEEYEADGWYSDSNEESDFEEYEGNRRVDAEDYYWRA
jgi:hypothetical protein